MQANKKTLTGINNGKFEADYVRELFDYNEDTGLLSWKVSRGNSKAGSIVGTVCRGERRIKIDGVKYQANQIVWLWHTGEWSSIRLSPINGDSLDSRIENLQVGWMDTTRRTWVRAYKGNPAFDGVRHNGTIKKPRVATDVDGDLLGKYVSYDLAVLARMIDDQERN